MLVHSDYLGEFKRRQPLNRSYQKNKYQVVSSVLKMHLTAKKKQQEKERKSDLPDSSMISASPFSLTVPNTSWKIDY
jgi:hypothetical protein